MGELFFEERAIVVPGDKLASGMDYLPAGGAYRKNEDVVSSIVGLLNVNGRVLKVIPMKGKYLQKPGDMVIGKIADMTSSAWFVNIGGFNDGLLAVRDVPEYVETGEDLAQYYNYGDHIVAKVVSVNKGQFNLSMKNPGTRKLSGGRIVNVDSAKVPRIIGKQGSMISLVKEKTGCRIIVGQNGIVWLQGMPENELVATEAVQLINEKGHLQGLTELVGDFLDKRMKGIEVKPLKDEQDEQPRRERGYESRGDRGYDSRRERGYEPRRERNYDSRGRSDDRGRRPYNSRRGNDRGGRK